MTPAPFVVFALPRSRTAWLARFLTYGDWFCGHEQIRHARSIEDVRGWLAQPMTGTAETAAAPWWRTLHALAPRARVVVVRRPVEQVVASFLRTGQSFDPVRLVASMRRLDAKLAQVERRMPFCLSVRFEDLAQEETCARVFEHCLPYRHDPAWWARLAPVNIQMHMPALVRYVAAHFPQLERLAAQLKHRALCEMGRRPVTARDGFSFAVEPFDDWFRDGQALFAEHCTAVGEHPANALNKNTELARALERIGALQIVTARSNGRMFGYLMTIVAPSLESPDVTSAQHLTFYASPDAPGLGMKLQRAANQVLRERGVDEVFMRAGVRGSGERMGSLYRRLGAEDFGQMFKLELGG